MNKMTLFRSSKKEVESNTYYNTKCSVSSLSELEKAVLYDHVSCTYKNNHRSKDDYISADFVMMDLDNGHSDDPDDWKTIDDVAESFSDVGFYYIESRNHMKPKKDRKGQIKEARPKYHIYFPCGQIISDPGQYELLKGRIGALFPYFDTKCKDIAHFFYAVPKANGGEIEGQENIDDYISELESDGILQNNIKDALDDYHKHEDFIPVKTWDQVAGGYKTSSKEDDNAESGDDTDQVLSRGVVEKLIREHEINVYDTKKTDKHLIYYVDCINSENHTTTSANHTDAFISISANGMINFHCNHEHCDGIHWKEYKKYYQDRDKTKCEKNTEAAPRQFDIELVQGKELQKKDLPPIIYPIENIIPEGYTIGSAPFKFGKSWLALEMCLAIAEGSPFLGQNTTKGSTVYMALEDCDKFAQERLNMVLDGREAPEGFYYIYDQVPPLDDGFIDYLNQLYNMVPDLKLVVIDVLAFIEHQAKRGESQYKCDYRTGTALKRWADEHQTSILAITHTTKMLHPNDVFMNTTGTSGVSGSADALLTIAKESRTEKEGILAITGRRVREKYFRVRLKDGYLWETSGEVDPETMERDSAQLEREKLLEEYRTSEIRKAVIKLANFGDDEELSSRDIIDKARDLDVYLLGTPKEIGGFICKYQNHFMKEDGIKVYIRKRGTASNTYKFVVWEEAQDGDKTLFNV